MEMYPPQLQRALRTQRRTCSVNARVITAPEPLVTRSVNEALPFLVGVPDTVTVCPLADQVIPVGRLPPVSAKVYGEVPPVTLICVE